MNLLISQPFGIGDAIFSMQLARNWIAEGHTITWPVFPQFVDQLQRAYPFITWLNSEKIPAPYHWREERDWYYEGVTYRYIPLRWANEIMGHSYDLCMADKFSLFGLDFQDWRKGAMWERDEENESQLQEMLGIADGEEYALMNQTFGSDCSMSIVLPTQRSIRTVEIKVISGFSLFDWVRVISNAAEIHTVSTSILFILEMMELYQPIHLYPRPTDPKFKQVEYIFSKNYILH